MASVIVIRGVFIANPVDDDRRKQDSALQILKKQRAESPAKRRAPGQARGSKRAEDRHSETARRNIEYRQNIHLGW
ncbi:uncharacterized protein J4E79_001819 [Alternaria viburni]|uniref:uncharacterized protein n=1 Tax=Alternaria viburni TaxID=566460 RepID=UPI0020C1F207|nr:uncharacterized protein J4E79_001819 [Alternaria viburni]KAI4667135.1 hypothetical protein J4E79_001819 [Alternaria viburni]